MIQNKLKKLTEQLKFLTKYRNEKSKLVDLIKKHYIIMVRLFMVE